jgi:hypothetical protein
MRRPHPPSTLRVLSLAAVVGATAAAAVPTARAEPRDEVSLGAAARALRSPSANAVTDDDLAGMSIGLARDLGHDLGVEPVPGLALWVEAGLVTGTASGTMFQSLFTKIEQLGLTGGIAVRYRLHRLITASARGAVGAQRARLAISDRSATAYDHAWGAMASAGAALDVFAVSRPRFGLGVRAELGYVAAQGIALTPRTDRADDTLAITMADAAIGHLDLSGPSVALSLLGQF